MKTSLPKIFILVTVSALVGMVMGGAFGYFAAVLSPGLFATLIPWIELEPVGAAIVLGAIVGVLLGGGLGVFAVIIQLLSDWISHRKGSSSGG
jgi:hypothetical protein